jgi:hypothetical protein
MHNYGLNGCRILPLKICIGECIVIEKRIQWSNSVLCYLFQVAMNIF